MRKASGTWIRTILGLATAATLAGCGGSASSGTMPAASLATTQSVCGPAVPEHARCLAIVRTDIGMSSSAFARTSESLRTIAMVPRGLEPADLQQAYGYSSAGGSGQTIALIDAYDAPNVESDLAVYRSHFGLPPCTSATGCFRKVAQNGTANYPAVNTAWATETSVDTQIAAGVCPNCKLMVVEANSDSFGDLADAVDEAVALGATVISNSFGTPEWAGETAFESHWNHPGVVITASAGDAGYGVEYPAASRYTVAVGGTALVRAANSRGYTESVWKASSSGCSAYIAKPSWQHDAGCSGRTVSDVAFTAGTDLPVIAYQSVCSTSVCGWTAFGGTSVSAPAVAGLFALAGNAAIQTGAAGLYASSSSNFYDVESGADGSCGTYLCEGLAGYDAPSGLGTPHGLAAF